MLKRHNTKMSDYHFLLLVLILTAAPLVGCQSAYYGVMEKVGVHKRDILVSRVKKGRDEQEQAKVQFQDALEKFTAVVKVDGGALEAKYKELKASLGRCESSANDVRSRVIAIESVGDALFKEWAKELEQYSSVSLRHVSEQKMTKTHRRYVQLVAAMKDAEKKMEPVLGAFRDQVLYLKHNLNARAIDSLQNTVIELQNNVKQLVKEMEASIAEANSFITSMEK